MFAVGGSVPLGPEPQAWVWWNLAGFIVVALALLRLSRLHLVVALVLAAIAGTVLGQLTTTLGVIPTWSGVIITVLAASRIVRRDQRPNTGRSAP